MPTGCQAYSARACMCVVAPHHTTRRGGKRTGEHFCFVPITAISCLPIASLLLFACGISPLPLGVPSWQQAAGDACVVELGQAAASQLSQQHCHWTGQEGLAGRQAGGSIGSWTAVQGPTSGGLLPTPVLSMELLILNLIHFRHFTPHMAW